MNMSTRNELMGVRSRLLYGTQEWYSNEEHIRKLLTCWMELLRQMVDGVDSQPLKTQRIHNSDSDTLIPTFYI